jgi:hypothetical protein
MDKDNNCWYILGIISNNDNNNEEENNFNI